MAFKRGLEAKTAMGIGDIALAIKIDTFYSLDPSNLMQHIDGTYGPERIAISPMSTENTLVRIQRGESPLKLRFYAILSDKGEFIRLNKHAGRYVEFQDKKYKIPK